MSKLACPSVYTKALDRLLSQRPAALLLSGVVALAACGAAPTDTSTASSALALPDPSSTVPASIEHVMAARLSTADSSGDRRTISSSTPDGRVLLQRFSEPGKLANFQLYALPQYGASDHVDREHLFASSLQPADTFEVEYPTRFGDVTYSSADDDSTVGLGATFKLTPRPVLDGTGKGFLAHDLRYGLGAVPIASAADCLGQDPGHVRADETGSLLCYKMIAYFNFTIEYASGTGHGKFDRMFQAPVSFVLQIRDDTRVPVAQPKLRAGAFDGPWALLRIAHEGKFRGIRGASSSVTADGRIVVWEEEGNVGDGTNAPWNPNPFKINPVIFNPAPWNSDGWSEPVPLGEAYAKLGPKPICPGAERCSDAERVRLDHVFKLFGGPFRSPFGEPLTKYLRCAYAWIAPDGENMACSGFVDGSPSRLLLFAGRSTDYTVKVADTSANGANGAFGALAGKVYLGKRFCKAGPECWHIGDESVPDFLNTELKYSLQLGTTSGFWRVLPGGRPRGFTETLERPSFEIMTRAPLFSVIDPFHGGTVVTDPADRTDFVYSEISTQDFEDPDYLAYYTMAPAVRAQTDSEIQAQITAHKGKNDSFILSEFSRVADRVADTSGQLNTGALRGGAVPESVHFGRDFVKSTITDYRSVYSLEGLVGKAVYMESAAASIDVAGASPSLSAPRDEFSVELGFEPLDGSLADADARLLSWSGVSRLGLRGGKLVVELRDGRTGHWSSFTVDAPILSDATKGWVHVGVSVRSASSGAPAALSVFRNGVPIDLRALPYDAAFRPETGDAPVLQLGPAGTCKGCGGSGVYALDEVGISSTFRTRAHYQIAAKAIELTETNDYPLSLPPGFSKDEVQVDPVLAALLSDRTKYDAAIAVGERLFSDPVLSTDRTGVSGGISCATCHHADLDFTDGKRLAEGRSKLQLNAPTIVNRIFGRQQFFDQRADTLADQVLMPIANPNEMGGDLTEIMRALRHDAGYVRAFRPFARGDITSADLQKALVAFVSSIRAGVDLQAHAGDPRFVRGEALFQGKARCVTCHSGPNFTDEMRHQTRADSESVKTPSLVNVARTAPYFHDGTRKALEDVVAFYRSAPGGEHVDTNLVPIDLSEAEAADLVYFLQNLTGEVASGVAAHGSSQP